MGLAPASAVGWAQKHQGQVPALLQLAQALLLAPEPLSKLTQAVERVPARAVWPALAHWGLQMAEAEEQG